MTLSQYLADHKLTRAQFAALGGWHPITVSRWCSGAMHPRPQQMRTITALTEGAVTANDAITTRRHAGTEARI